MSWEPCRSIRSLSYDDPVRVRFPRPDIFTDKSSVSWRRARVFASVTGNATSVLVEMADTKGLLEIASHKSLQVWKGREEPPK